MRLAVISDIHGNAYALDVALADIAAQGVDQIVCLGRRDSRGSAARGDGRSACATSAVRSSWATPTPGC